MSESELKPDVTEESMSAKGPEILNSEPKPDSTEKLTEELKNKVLYMTAEMENLRKRFVREKSEVIKYANEELLKAIFPIFDNLNLALKSTKGVDSTALENPLIKNLVVGFEMTVKHFEQTLERLGVASIPTAGQNFDPTLHEAIGQDSKADLPNNSVIAELQKGFTLNGRVIKAARVIVNKIQEN